MVNVPKEIAALGFQQAELRKQIARQLMAQKQAQQQQRDGCGGRAGARTDG
jgi:hypothetical protein